MLCKVKAIGLTKVIQSLFESLDLLFYLKTEGTLWGL